ncbi:MAG TPA: TlpA disulfide reductase family protein [Gammaproteobacteria bacterium]
MRKALHFLFITLVLLVGTSTAANAQQAPAFSLASDNGDISLNQYRNKIVYVDFWASWCKPCRESFSFMNEMQKKYAGKGLQIIAINLDDQRSAADAFLSKYPAQFKIAYDPEGKTPAAYGVKVMPTSYLLDRKGNIIFTHKGFKHNQSGELEQLIAQALK